MPEPKSHKSQAKNHSPYLKDRCDQHQTVCVIPVNRPKQFPETPRREVAVTFAGGTTISSGCGFHVVMKYGREVMDACESMKPTAFTMTGRDEN